MNSTLLHKIQAIIFDFDGVLFDSELLHFESCNKVFNELGFNLTFNQDYIHKCVGIPDIDSFPVLFKEKGLHFSPEEINQFVNKKIQIYLDLIKSHNTLDSFSGMPEFIHAMSKMLSHFAICSSSSHQEIDLVLGKICNGDLKKYFKLITAIEDVTLGKPSPEGYLKTANFLKVPPENCLVIEDSRNGVNAAKAANMHVIAITTTHDKSALTHADYIFNNYNEIKKFILDELN